MLRSITTHLVYLLKFLLRRKYFGRFILLTPSILENQFLLDRKFRRIVRIKVRNQIDLQTLKMIFLWGDYDLENLRRRIEIYNNYTTIVRNNGVPLIVDLGGHAGISAAYFAYCYPLAKVVVIEPQESNYVQALKNTRRFKNTSIQNVAIGDSCGRADLNDPGLGNDSYRTVFTGEKGSVEVIDMKKILAQYPEPAFIPFIVKCDIEGAEERLFSSNTDWVPKFGVLIIELHDWLLPGQETSKNFLRTISRLEGDFVSHGENSFFIQYSALGMSKNTVRRFMS
jgi:FkbM family methyltransferase